MPDRYVKYFFILLCLSSFGPYIHKGLGLRTEHLFIYASLALVGIFMLFRLSKFKVERNLFTFFVLLTMPLIWITVVSVGLGGAALSASSLPVFENFFQASAIVLLFVFFSNYKSISPHFESFIKAFLVFLSANTIIIVLQVIFGYELFGIMEAYSRVRSVTSGDLSVAEKAASLGRYMGIFNQPLEAGASYSLGLLGWVYLETNRINFDSKLRYALLFLLILGGLVSISKIFLLGGLVLFLWYLLVYGQKKIRRRILFFIPVVGMGVGYYLSTIEWRGLAKLAQLFLASDDRSFIETVTAGRFGSEESAVREVFELVFAQSPYYGFGMKVPPVLDNGFAEYFFHGGLIGLLFFVVLLIWLLYKSIDFLLIHRRKYILLYLIIVLMLGLSIGAPAFTMNRFSVNVTMFICFLFLLRKGR